MYKAAVGPAVSPPAPTGQPQQQPEFSLPDFRSRLSQMPAPGFQQARIQPYHPDWNSRQVYEAAQAIRNAPAARMARGMTPQQRANVRQYNRLRGWTINTLKKSRPPVFAPPGKPGAANQSSIHIGAQPFQPKPPGILPGQPVPPPRQGPPPIVPPQRPQPPAPPQRPPVGVIPGQPLPQAVGGGPLRPGYFRDDQGNVRPMSPDYIRLQQRFNQR